MNIAVTGAESFIGRVLIPLLRDQGADVVAIDSRASEVPGGTTVDIRSPELADALPERGDAIIHLAAISRESDCAADPPTAFDVNVTGSANVVSAAQKRGIRQVVLASSEWVYGEVANDAAQDEESAIDINRVLNEYAASKIASEMVVNVGVKRGLSSGTVLRFGIVYGPRPGNWSAVESLLNQVRTEEVVTVGSLATARRFVHVRDIASGIVAALGTPGFEIFNLAGSELVALDRVVRLSMAATGRNPQIVERDAGSRSIRNPVSTKAQRVLGWEPAVPIDVGITELADYFAGQQAG